MILGVLAVVGLPREWLNLLVFAPMLLVGLVLLVLDPSVQRLFRR